MYCKKFAFLIGTFWIFIFLVGAKAKDEGSHPKGKDPSKETKGKEVTLKGEVLDLICYLKEGKNPDCAASCLRSGSQAAVKDENGKIYLLTLNKKKTNVDMLGAHAGKSVTMKGNLVSREGIHLLNGAYIEIKRPEGPK